MAGGPGGHRLTKRRGSGKQGASARADFDVSMGQTSGRNGGSRWPKPSRDRFRSSGRRSPRFPTASISAAPSRRCWPPGSTRPISRCWPRTSRWPSPRTSGGELTAAGLTEELKYIAPLTVAGIVLISGGPIAATVAALVGAGLGGAALKEIFDDYTAPPHRDEFAAALQCRRGAAMGALRRPGPRSARRSHPRRIGRPARPHPRPIGAHRRGGLSGCGRPTSAPARWRP